MSTTSRERINKKRFLGGNNPEQYNCLLYWNIDGLRTSITRECTRANSSYIAFLGLQREGHARWSACCLLPAATPCNPYALGSLPWYFIALVWFANSAFGFSNSFKLYSSWIAWFHLGLRSSDLVSSSRTGMNEKWRSAHWGCPRSCQASARAE